MIIVRTSDVEVQRIMERIRKSMKERRTKSAKMLYEYLPDGSWKGRRCFLIGGGPSLKDFDFERLRGELIIGINRAYEKVDCDILFGIDNKLYEWILKGELGEEAKEKFLNFKGIKVWMNMRNYNYDDSIYQVDPLGNRGISESLERGLCHGGNSGYAAINLAVCLGANPIYLLGYDMKHGKRGSHWHEGYPEKQNSEVLDNFNLVFQTSVPLLKKLGIRVINLNPDSALRCFPFSTIEEVLGNGKS